MFLEKLVKLLDLPGSTTLKSKNQKLQMRTIPTLFSFLSIARTNMKATANESTPSASLDCQLTAQEVTVRFSSTALPMNSELMIIALRNLENYLLENNLPQPQQQPNLHKSHRVFHQTTFTAHNIFCNIRPVSRRKFVATAFRSSTCSISAAHRSGSRAEVNVEAAKSLHHRVESSLCHHGQGKLRERCEAARSSQKHSQHQRRYQSHNHITKVPVR
jgi:hypothetical protein